MDAAGRRLERIASPGELRRVGRAAGPGRRPRRLERGRAGPGRPRGGKAAAALAQASQSEQSDGLHVWIDTRDVHNVHRAGRFCHRFAFLPGGPRRHDQPLAELLPINCAREQPRSIRSGLLQVRSEKRIDGYLLEAFIPAAALTGFDPQEHPRLGFTYALLDRELGEQTLGVGSPMPYQEDPSLWATLELLR